MGQFPHLPITQAEMFAPFVAHNHAVRMKAEYARMAEEYWNHGRSVFTSDMNRAVEPKNAPKHPRPREKLKTDLEKELQN